MNTKQFLLSCEYGNYDVVKQLMEDQNQNQDQDQEQDQDLINSVDHIGRSGLFWASRNDHLGVVKYLLKNGADIDSVDNSGKTIYHAASFNGCTKTMEFLCQNMNENDLNTIDKYGKTPLHWAVESNKVSINLIQHMLEAGADPKFSGTFKKTPLEICKRHEIKQIMKDYLKKRTTFYRLFKKQICVDEEICGFGVHSLIINSRLNHPNPTVILRKYSKSKIGLFLKWVYGKTLTNKQMKEILEILHKFGIKNYKTKTGVRGVYNALQLLMNDEKSKDFTILVKLNRVKGTGKGTGTGTGKEKQLGNGEEQKTTENEDESTYTKIKVHKFILRARSEYFNEYFLDPENNCNYMIDHTGYSVQAYECFLRWCYSSALTFTADDNKPLLLEDLENFTYLFKLPKYSGLQYLINIEQQKM
ncbi:ankyrin repeat and death domain-containing protein [Anaeramoeba flamelloides]|uniref:Ankyrin repeat and death domain-containing protein n=1 Tax=Anaeramoeba flamelloides TaxID=1746091 RepID=A0AAV7ZUD0_9EUKA|nr:ankyrin repeat and death domain-containing protein [Anaeramoeba flamelloides]